MTNYHFSYKNASTQYVDIAVTIPAGGLNMLSVQLPAWRPGRYELGNFAKNVKGFRIEDEQGKPVAFEKITKDCWEVETHGLENIILKYSYYANMLNAGSTWLDNNQLYVNPVNCCVYAAGMENYPCRVEIDVPRNYKLACGEKHTEEFSDTGVKLAFETEDFDRLADTPFIASATTKHDTYEEAGTLFHLWFVGECKPGFEKIKADFKAFTAKQIAVMGSIPVKEYHFYFQILPTPFHHGVEHLTSTVIGLGPSYKLMMGEVYEDFLGVSSHELFHVWNIKTIRPAEMLPYDFTGENYFTTGFVAEGVTTYYGDTFLLRSKVFNNDTYFALLADTIQRHYHNYARHNYSVAASGFDTWLDGYVPGAPQRKVSIYNEGCLLAFALDVQIRKHSNNQHSLDDVMRRLYEDFGLKNRGYLADDYKTLAEVAAGSNFDDFFADYIFGTKPYNDLLNESLAYLGLELVEKPSGQYAERIFGFKTDGGKVATIAPHSPAEKAGLTIGDTLVAVNGFTGSFNDWFNYFACETVKLTVNNGGVLKDIYLHPCNEQYYPTYSINMLDNATAEQKAAFESWSN
jgi:predicted metalloprotease with PDZ domain